MDSGDGITGQQGLPLQAIIVPPDPDPISKLRVVSVLPFELPPLQGEFPTGSEVRVDGNVIAANLPFIGTTGYIEVEPGTHTVEFRVFGDLIGSGSVNIEDGEAP